MSLESYQYSQDQSKLKHGVNPAKWHWNYTWTPFKNLNSLQTRMSSGLALTFTNILPPQLQEAPLFVN